MNVGDEIYPNGIIGGIYSIFITPKKESIGFFGENGEVQHIK